LHPSISDGVIDPKREYSIVRKDRIGTKGGGVCILVKRSFSVIPLQLDTRFAALEVTGVEFICLSLSHNFLLCTYLLTTIWRQCLTCSY